MAGGKVDALAQFVSADGHLVKVSAANPLPVTGGGGGGGGGAATIADGADVAEGATTAAAYSDVTGAAAGTTIGLLKGNYVITAAMSAKLPSSPGPKSGANSLSVVPNTDTPFIVLGSLGVGVSNTANPLTTGGFAMSASPTAVSDGQVARTWLSRTGATMVGMPNVTAGDGISNGSFAAPSVGSGTVSGGIIAASLMFNGTTWDRVRGDTTGGAWVHSAVAAGTADSGNAIKVGGRARGTQMPAVTTDQRQDAWFQLNGSQSVTVCGSNGSVGALGIPAAGLSGQTGLYVASQNAEFNGSTWDAQRKGTVLSRLVASATGGSPTNVKTTAGDIHLMTGTNAAAITYLQIYNKASAPVIGTDTPAYTFQILANAAFTIPLPKSLYLSAGIGYAFTTDAAGTTAAAASAVIAFGLIGA